jgi:hypothetical protein
MDSKKQKEGNMPPGFCYKEESKENRNYQTCIGARTTVKPDYIILMCKPLNYLKPECNKHVIKLVTIRYIHVIKQYSKFIVCVILQKIHPI